MIATSWFSSCGYLDNFLIVDENSIFPSIKAGYKFINTIEFV
jgi:hypothetical protein